MSLTSKFIYIDPYFHLARARLSLDLPLGVSSYANVGWGIFVPSASTQNLVTAFNIEWAELFKEREIEGEMREEDKKSRKRAFTSVLNE